MKRHPIDITSEEAARINKLALADVVAAYRELYRLNMPKFTGGYWLDDLEERAKRMKAEGLAQMAPPIYWVAHDPLRIVHSRPKKIAAGPLDTAEEARAAIQEIERAQATYREAIREVNETVDKLSVDDPEFHGKLASLSLRKGQLIHLLETVRIR